MPSSAMARATAWIASLLVMVEASEHRHHRHHNSFLGYRKDLDTPDFEMPAWLYKGPRHHRNNRHHSHHHRHHQPDASLAVMGVSVPEGDLDFDAGEPSGGHLQAQDVYAHTHPLIAHSLDGMGEKLKELKDEQEQASSVTKHIADGWEEVMKSGNGGAPLARLMVGAKAEARTQEQVLRKLEDEESHLQQEHDSIALKLQAIMKPRIGAVEHKVERKRQAVAKAQTDAKRWDQLRSKYKASALQTMSDRKEKLQAVRDAEEEMKKADEQADAAKMRYEEARKKVSQEIEAYKVSQTRFEAIQSKLADRKADEAQAESSLRRTRNIFKVEGERVDAALKFGEAKLDKRVMVAKAQHEKARRKFRLAKERLLSWQTEQKKLASKVSDLKDEYEGKQHDVNENRDRVLTAAADRAGAQATSQSGWSGNDWANANAGDLGPDAADIAESK